MLGQQAVQFTERLHRHAWGTEGHCSADGSVQHPPSDRQDDAVPHLHVNHLSSGAALAVHAPQSSAVQGVPTIEDLDFLPDMGRMNRNWRRDARTGCSPGRCWRASAPRPS